MLLNRSPYRYVKLPGGGGGGGTGAGANEPVGYTKWFDFDWTAVPPLHPPGNTNVNNLGGNENFGNHFGTAYPSFDNLSIVSDPTAPFPPHCLQEMYPAGMPWGGSPITWDQEDCTAPANTGKLYYCFRIQIGSSVGATGWSNNGVTGTKVFQIQTQYDGGGTFGTNHYFGFNSSTTPGQYGLMNAWFATQFSGTQPFVNYPCNISNPNLNDGLYHTYELWQVPETTPGGTNGIYKLWIDGTLSASYANANYYAPGSTPRIKYIKSDGTYGGGSGTIVVPNNQWFRFNRPYASLA